MDNTNQQAPPVQNTEPSQTPPPNPSSSLRTFIIVLCVVLLTIIGAGGYMLGTRKNQTVVQNQQISGSPSATQSSPTPTSTPDETANWKTYVDSDNKFSVKYPPNLIVVGGAFYKKDDFERAKPAGPAADDFLENYLARITVTTYTSRFEAYYNALENSIVKGYSDTILKKYVIDGYKAIEYGYDKQKKEEDIKEQEEALRSGASVTMIYFEKGLMINRKGTIIEISTLSYYGDFKNTFDQILSTFQFTN